MVTAEQVDLQDELASTCGVLNASHALLAAIVAGALDDESWALAGVRSPEHWLVMRAGLSPFHARAVVAVARRHQELPTVMGQFADGQLSLDQVTVVARYAPAHVEAAVAEFAVNATVPQLRAALSRYSFDPPRPPGQAGQVTTFGAWPCDTQTCDTQPCDTQPCDTQADDSATGDSAAGDSGTGDAGAGDTQADQTAPGDATTDERESRNAGAYAGADDAEVNAAVGDSQTGCGFGGGAFGDAATGRGAFGGGAFGGDAAAGGGASGAGASGAGAAGDPPTWNGLGLKEDRSGAPPELSMSQDEYGRFVLRFTAPADLGALVAAALAEAKDALFRAGQPQPSMGEAMVEMAKRSLGSVESINRRDAYRTYVHLDSEGGWLTGRPRLPAHIATKLTCDGILQPVWHTQGAPVNVGRAQRIVPARTRRLVEDRDRGCRFPGCTSTHVECHHLIHWVDGGPTDTFNLCCLCDFHHDAHHDGDFTITGNANHPARLIFTTRTGQPIKPGPTFTTPPPARPPQRPRPPGAASPPAQPSATPPPPEPPTPSSPEPPRSTQSPPAGSPATPTPAGPPGSAGAPRSPEATRSSQTAASVETAESAGSPSSPESPESPGTAGTAGTTGLPSPAQPGPRYRGPTGESLHLRWISFDEPRKPAHP